MNHLSLWLWSGTDFIYYYQHYEVIKDTLSNPGYEITSIIVNIIGLLISWGLAYTLLAFRDNDTKPNVFVGIFSAFDSKYLKNTFLTSILAWLFNFLWYWVFVIPGIIKGYSYAMAPYILKDMIDSGKSVSATEAITESRKLMVGHKMDLFVLQLSFIGWWLLSILTFGIGFLWLVPYYQETKANFYRNLAEEKYLNTSAN